LVFGFHVSAVVLIPNWRG